MPTSAGGLPASDLAAGLAALRQETLLYAYRVLGSWDDAEDAVQDAQAKAWGCRHRFGGTSQVRPWLFLMTKWACMDTLVPHKKQVLVSESARWSDEVSQFWIDPAPTPEERLLAECVSAEVEAAINALPGAGMQAAVRLVYLAGLEVGEAAGRLGISNHAVAMHTWKARPLLRRSLREWMAQRCAPAGHYRDPGAPPLSGHPPAETARGLPP